MQELMLIMLLMHVQQGLGRSAESSAIRNLANPDGDVLIFPTALVLVVARFAWAEMEPPYMTVFPRSWQLEYCNVSSPS